MINKIKKSRKKIKKVPVSLVKARLRKLALQEKVRDKELKRYTQTEWEALMSEETFIDRLWGKNETTG